MTQLQSWVPACGPENKVACLREVPQGLGATDLQHDDGGTFESVLVHMAHDR